MEEMSAPMVPDEAVANCSACGTSFGLLIRKHHCRNCGNIFCDKCTHGRIALTIEADAPLVRICDQCMNFLDYKTSFEEKKADYRKLMGMYQKMRSVDLKIEE